jgi:hypothetical protein
MLPSYRRLLTAACYATAPFIALFLILGKPWWAASMMAGLAMSAAVGGLLHVLIGRAMGYFVAGLRGPASGAPQAGSMLQFGALVLLKFLLLAGIAWAIVSIHGLNLMVVLAGFLVGHTAIIIAASRHLKQR